MKKRLSQLEALDAFTILEGLPLARGREERMVKRGLAARRNGKLVLTEEGREAFRRWVG